MPAVVAINRFPTDTEAELGLIRDKCKALGVNVALSEVWAKGSKGGLELAEEILKLVEKPSELKFAYDLNMPIKEKINEIAKKVYGADGADFLPKAEKEIEKFEKLGFGNVPICMATGF